MKDFTLYCTHMQEEHSKSQKNFEIVNEPKLDEVIGQLHKIAHKSSFFFVFSR